MQISEVNLSELNEEWRIDSEYYSPDNLEIAKLITSKPHILASRLFDFVSGPFGSTVKKSNYTIKKEFRYIRGKDVTPFFIDDSDPVFIKKELYNSLPQYHLKKGDILVTVVGMNFGLCAIIFDENEGAIFSCKSSLLTNPRIDPLFFITYLSCKYGYSLIRRGKRGAAQPGINLFDIKNVPIPETSSTFQKMISDIVYIAKDYLDKSKEQYQQASEILLNQLGLQEWKPFHELTYISNYSNSIGSDRLDAEFFQPKFNDMFNQLKPSIKLEQLGIIVTLTKGIEVGGKSYLDEGIPFWRVSNISKLGIEHDNCNYISDQLYQKYRSLYEPKQGEILLTKDATPGIAFYLDRSLKGIISGGILRLSIIKDIPPQYLEIVLNSIFVQQQIEQHSGGSIIKHWKPDEVRKTLIPRLKSSIESKISDLVKLSHENRLLSNKHIEKAKRAIEISIEQNENIAKEYINNHEIDVN